jgi:diketogulonate reductase-like aldo/keto reductase
MESGRVTNKPMQLHPWLQQKKAVKYCQDHGIAVEAYCPLVRNSKADDETLTNIAGKHGVTTNQVLVRYCLQKSWIPLPKSDNPERIRLNGDVFGFTLKQEDMEALNSLDQGRAGALVQAVDD